MKNIWRHIVTRGGWLTLALSLVICCTGCVAVYVDPHYRSATYMDVHGTNNPRPVAVKVEFQFNGKHWPSQDTDVRLSVLKVLRASKVFAAVDATNAPVDGMLQVTLDDTGSLGAAFGKGFITGLTYGLIGSEVEDHYFMTLVYTPAHGIPFSRKYEHSIYATVGLHSAPQGMERVSVSGGVDTVIEDMMLNFLRDWQNASAVAPEAAPK